MAAHRQGWSPWEVTGGEGESERLGRGGGRSGGGADGVSSTETDGRGPGAHYGPWTAAVTVVVLLVSTIMVDGQRGFALRL